MVKALLLLQNVNVEARLTNSEVPRKILLAGNSKLLQELMELRKQIGVLKHSCYILRAQVLQLQMAIPQTVEWVFLSAKDAVAMQSTRQKQLQTRLAKLQSLIT